MPWKARLRQKDRATCSAPERHQKCVEIFSRAEKPRENLLANQPEHAAAKNRDADDAGRARADSLSSRR